MKHVPNTFASVAERDIWLWRDNELEPTPLLSEADVNARLGLMPAWDGGKAAVGMAWVDYATNVASLLEAQGRSTEASAYWISSLDLLVASHILEGPHVPARLAGYVRCALSRGGGEDPAERIRSALFGGDAGSQIDAVRVLAEIVAMHESFVDELALSPKVRAEIGRVAQASALRRGGSDQTGISRLLATDLTRIRTELANVVTSLNLKGTLDQLKSKRQTIMKLVGELKPFMLESEQTALMQLQAVLSAKLSAYLESSHESDDDSYDQFIAGAQDGFSQIRTSAGVSLSCYLAPLLANVLHIVQSHYDLVVRSSVPEMRLRVSKPFSAGPSTTGTFELDLSNFGASAANECAITLRSSDPAISFPRDYLSLGRLAGGRSEVVSVGAEWTVDSEGTDVEYRLEYRDLRGPQQEAGVAKLSRQRSGIDWSGLRTRMEPYPTQSINQVDQLKGRDELLAILRSGIQSRISFSITGQKRVGKTSLVKVLLSQLAGEPSLLPLYIPIGKLSIAADDDDLGKLGRDLSDQLVAQHSQHRTTPFGMKTPTTAAFKNSFNAAFTNLILQYADLHGGTQVIFAFDDFDELPTSLVSGPLAKAFFLALRTLMNEGTSFLLVGSERLHGVLQEQAERLNQVRSLPVDYLSDEALTALVRQPTEDCLHWTDEAVREVRSWSAGNPHFATLICQRVWHTALRLEDGWITVQDVRRAVVEEATQTSLGSYEHFWSDSSLAEREERDLYETKSSLVIVAVSKMQPDAMTWIPVSELGTIPGLPTDEGARLVNELLDRTVLTRHPEQRDLVRFRVPLFAEWLKRGGAEQVIRAAKLQPRAAVAARSGDLTFEEVMAAAEGLVYRGEKITSDEVRRWAAQFGDLPRQRLMLKLLTGVRKYLYTQSSFNIALTNLHQMVKEEARVREFPVRLQLKGRYSRASNILVTHADASGKSGGAVIKDYRSQNDIYETNVGAPDKIRSVLLAQGGHNIVICVNDFVGSGRSAVEDLNVRVLPTLSDTPGYPDSLLIVFGVVVGFEQGLARIRENVPGVVVVCPRVLTDADRAFSTDIGIWAGDEPLRAEELAREFGRRLEPQQPLGFEDSHALVVFHDNVPNNTLPILYKSKAGKAPWHPLFPRS